MCGIHPEAVAAKRFPPSPDGLLTISAVRMTQRTIREKRTARSPFSSDVGRHGAKPAPIRAPRCRDTYGDDAGSRKLDPVLPVLVAEQGGSIFCQYLAVRMLYEHGAPVDDACALGVSIHRQHSVQIEDRLPQFERSDPLPCNEVDEVDVWNEHGGIRRFARRPKERCRRTRLQKIVSCEDHDELARRSGHAGVDSRGDTAVRLVPNDPCPEVLSNTSTAVRRTVVDDHDLEINALFAERLDGLGEQGASVEAGNDCSQLGHASTLVRSILP